MVKQLILILLILSSCSVQQKANRKIKWLKEHNYLTKGKDTVKIYIPEFKDTGSTKLLVEYDTIKELYKFDTCYTKERVGKILSKVKIKDIHVDNDRVKLDIKVENGEIKYDYTVKPLIVEKEIEVPVLKDCPKEKWWDNFWTGFFFLLILLILYKYIFK